MPASTDLNHYFGTANNFKILSVSFIWAAFCVVVINSSSKLNISICSGIIWDPIIEKYL